MTPSVALGEFAVKRGGSVDPAKYPGETFQLFSIPAYDTGEAEVALGSQIGSSKKCVEPGDVLLSRIVPHIRRCWIVGPMAKHRQIASGEWISFRGDDFHPPYLKHFLMSDPFHAQFMQTVSGVGGSLLRAKPAEVYKIKLPLPPLPEQKRIAKILDAADALRAKRRESLAQLDALLQSTFLEMFGDPVENPKGWPTVKGGQIFAELKYGTSRKSKSDSAASLVPVLRIPNVLAGQIDWSDLKFADEVDSADPSIRLSEDDLLFVRTNGNPGYIGRCARFSGEREAVFASYLIRGRLNADAGLKSEFLKYQVEFPSFRRVVRKEAKTTAGNYNLSAKGIRNFVFIVPSEDLQERFAGFVASIDHQRKILSNQEIGFQELFASLQQLAFPGQL